MDSESDSTVNFEDFEKALATAIARARSLDDIEAWLKSQEGVKSVRLANYLSKSNPPQRDFIVEFHTPDNSSTQKVVNIFDLGNHQFKFRTLRER